MPVAKINVICGESRYKVIAKKVTRKLFLSFVHHGICSCTVPGVVNVHRAQGYGACAQLIMTGA